MRVLGLRFRRTEAPLHLVRALVATPVEAVREAFAELARRFPDEPFGRLAGEALSSWDAPCEAPAEASPSLAGDLDAFGLPELVQTLAGIAATGRLVLRDRRGATTAEIRFHDGRVHDGRAGRLGMPEGFYQLLEQPLPGSFEFVRLPADGVPPGPARDPMALLLEAARRCDELQRARALAPDHAHLVPTGARPTPTAREADGVFVRALWTRLRDGATPRQCEAAMPTDSYRVRSLLAHWLTEGALEIRTAPVPAPP